MWLSFIDYQRQNSEFTHPFRYIKLDNTNTEVMESELLSEKISSLLEVFNETFQHVDGGSISQDVRGFFGQTLDFNIII